MSASTIVLHVTAPPNTPQRAPVTQTLPCALPVIIGGVLVIPAGAVGLVGARISAKGRPVYPDNGLWRTGNGLQEVWGDGPIYRIPGPTLNVTLEVYNLDDTYPHTVEATVYLQQVRP